MDTRFKVGTVVGLVVKFARDFQIVVLSFCLNPSCYILFFKLFCNFV